MVLHGRIVVVAVVALQGGVGVVGLTEQGRVAGVASPIAVAICVEDAWPLDGGVGFVAVAAL